MDFKISAMYAENKRSYMAQHGFDVLKTIVPVAAVIAMLVGSSYGALIKEARTNWATKQCNPIYMPFAGKIMPEAGKTEGRVTLDNFNYCIHKEISAFVSIILMPLEFVNFVILTTIDITIKSMVAAMKLAAKLSLIMKKFGMDITSKIANFLVPIIIIIVKMRDAMARSSASVSAAIYTTLTIYKTIISGLMNLMNILLTLLIALSILIAAMFVTAAVLTALIVTAPAGIALNVVASLLLILLFTPTLIMYIILQVFMADALGAPAPKAPF